MLTHIVLTVVIRFSVRILFSGNVILGRTLVTGNFQHVTPIARLLSHHCMGLVLGASGVSQYHIDASLPALRPGQLRV